MKKLENAIRAGDIEKVRKLIAAGVDVSAAFADGTKPIQLAAQDRQVTILRALAAAGADLADLEVLTPEQRLNLFLDSSLDLQSDEDLLSASELSTWAMQAVAEQVDENFITQINSLEGLLLRAARTDNLDLLKEGLAAGEDVNQISEITRDTALSIAVQKADEEMVEVLLAAGANVNHAGFSTPLSFALPHLWLAKLLLDAGADAYGRGFDLRTPLERAVDRALSPSSSYDSPLLVRFFLEAGVDPVSAESCAGTLLEEAVYSKAWEMHQELLPHYPEEIARSSCEELEFDKGLKEIDGGAMQWTFDLRYEARGGHLDKLREVLARQPQEVNFAKEIGLAVLAAVSTMELKALPILIEAGADLNAAESYEKVRGSSPLAAAAESWHRRSKEAMRLLIDAGADVDQRGHCQRTPLMYAVHVAYRHGVVLKKAIPFLLQAGADLNLEDQFGHTAWTLAKAPLIEQEEPSGDGEIWFEGPDLSELLSDSANQTDQRRSQLDRCREALELLEAAGATAHGEAELRLVLAARAGDAELVEKLLEAGANADARAIDGMPAIVAAAQSGQIEIVHRLIAAGCRVDVSTPGQPSALEVAVRSTDVAMTRALIDAGSNVVMLACIPSDNPLTAAEESGATEIVEMIRGALPPELANIDRDVAQEIALDDLTYESQRDLPRQAAFGDLDKVRELLAVKGVEIDGFDALSRTALSAAAEAGRHPVVQELLEAGADVNKCNEVVGSPRSTALVCAAIGPSAERDGILKLLFAAGVDADQLGSDGRTALSHAVERDVGFFGRAGEFALSTRTLIEAGADLEIRDRYDLTPRMRALSLASSIEIEEVAEQYQALARLLEEAGASKVGLAEIELLWAVMAGEVEQVRELLAAGVNANARRHDGPTALILAARDGERDSVRLLTEAGADVLAREWVDRGPTALDTAADGDDHALTRILREAQGEDGS